MIENELTKKNDIDELKVGFFSIRSFFSVGLSTKSITKKRLRNVNFSPSI